MLIDIHVADIRAYGIHSFRRGGCQYLAKALRWQLRQICAWGGWSESETGTVFKYLFSHVDDVDAREDYFNPQKKARMIDKCGFCGRSCGCR